MLLQPWLAFQHLVQRRFRQPPSVRDYANSMSRAVHIQKRIGFQPWHFWHLATGVLLPYWSIDDVLPIRIPIDAITRPIGPRRHHASNRMRESMVDGCTWLLAGSHGVEPIFEMMCVVVVRADGIRRGRAGHFDDLAFIVRYSHSWWRDVSRLTDVSGRIGFVRTAFLRAEEQRRTFAAEIVDGSFGALNSSKAAITVTERGCV